MKEFGKVSSQFWISDDIQPLSDRAKLMALYLLTTGHGNLIGIFKLSRGYIADDLCWDRSVVQKALTELESNNFLTLSEQGNYLCINRFMDHNPTVNQKQIIARLNALLLLPDALSDMLPEAVAVVERVLAKACSGKASREVKTKAEQVRRLLERSSEKVRPKKIEDRKENIEEEKTLVRSDDRTTKPATLTVEDHFDQWWAAYPKREGDKGHRGKSLGHYKTRLKEPGNTPANLMNNLMAYCRYCDQTGNTGSQYVKTTTAYLNNPDNVTNPWTVNHEARQGTAEKPSLIDQVYQANKHLYEAEPDAGYHPENDSGAVWDHDGHIRGEVDSGARAGGSDGAVAGDFEGPAPEPVGDGH